MAFIDYSKCFDSINRQTLFKTLGITGNFLNAIKALYTTVLAAVRNNGEMSNYFQCSIGLKQGCLLSPNYLQYLSQKFQSLLMLMLSTEFMPGLKAIHHLFFVDDAILLSDAISGLQNKLNLIEMQSERLVLEVNLDKTHIVVLGRVTTLVNMNVGNLSVF